MIIFSGCVKNEHIIVQQVSLDNESIATVEYKSEYNTIETIKIDRVNLHLNNSSMEYPKECYLKMFYNSEKEVVRYEIRAK
mgnify:CR=1 FL=1